MEEFRCKTCGTLLQALAERSENGLVECPSCYNVWTVPQRETPPAALAFLRMGEHDLDTCNFEDAYSAYQKAAELAAKESEAYFGMALADFKVQYLKDETATPPRMQPICHEISKRSFSSDKNFLHATELAGSEKKRIYYERAAEIDSIREQFFKLKESGLTYDCFLCAKVSDGAGGVTQDSHEALKLYHHLKSKGYHPFYSEEETKSRTGSDYEALILYALYTSSCMLIVCFDESYLRTKWMKNEYTRFASLIAGDGDAMAFVFRGTPVERLPGKSGALQGIDLAQPDAYSRIEDYVERHTPKARARREEEERRKREREEERERAFVEMQRRLRELEEERASAALAQAGPASFGKCVYCGGEVTVNEELMIAECPCCLQRMPLESVFPAAYVRNLREKHRQEEERKRERARLAEEERRRTEQEALLAFEIKDGVLVKYNGRGKEAVIPDGVTEIGDRSFWGSNCSSLIRLKIPDSVQKISSTAFLDCYRLAVVTLPKRFKRQIKSLFFGKEKIIHFIYTE